MSHLWEGDWGLDTEPNYTVHTAVSCTYRMKLGESSWTPKHWGSLPDMQGEPHFLIPWGRVWKLNLLLPTHLAAFI